MLWVVLWIAGLALVAVTGLRGVFYLFACLFLGLCAYGLFAGFIYLGIALKLL